jgi:hypothetical protein
MTEKRRSSTEPVTAITYRLGASWPGSYGDYESLDGVSRYIGGAMYSSMWAMSPFSTTIRCAVCTEKAVPPFEVN